MVLLTIASESTHGSAIGGTIADVLGALVVGISLVGAAVLTWGVLVGVVTFLRAEAKRIRGVSCDAERLRIRRQVGFYLLFALELLIAADIIETMIEPSFERLGILAGITALRIATGYFLGKELHDPGA